MNTETTTHPFPTSLEQSSGGANLNGNNANLHRAAQKIHEAVDTLEQKIGQGSEKVMGMQQEYGDLCREQVRSNPLAALGVAFAAGFVVAKIFR